MHIKIKATNTTLTPQIEEYISKKVEALDKLVSKEDTSAQVAVEVGKTTEHHKSGDVFFAEFNLHIAGGDFIAKQEAADLYAAIDIAKDELMHAVRAHKGKQQTMLRRGGQMVKNMLRGFGRKRK